jgi:hypothetical protein
MKFLQNSQGVRRPSCQCSVSLILVSLLTGCADFSSTPTQVNRHFGEAVLEMQLAQTYNPDTRRYPSSEPILTRDGQKIHSLLNSTYRNDVWQIDLQRSEKDNITHNNTVRQ